MPIDAWLDESEMAEEAVVALGPDAQSTLRRQAHRHQDELTAHSTPGFQAFADLLTLD